MDVKRAYEIIEDVDSCLLNVSEIRELTELFRAGFEMQNVKTGVIAADVIIRRLQNIEKDLNAIHVKLDMYGLLSNVDFDVVDSEEKS